MNQLSAAVERLERERAESEKRIEDAQRTISIERERLARLTVAVEELQAIISGEPAQASTPRKRQTLYSLILDVLSERGRATDEELLADIQAKGWSTTSADALGLVRSALSRLLRRQQVKRVARSTYELDQPAAHSDEDEVTVVDTENSDGPSFEGPSDHQDQQPGGGQNATALVAVS